MAREVTRLRQGFGGQVGRKMSIRLLKASVVGGRGKSSRNYLKFSNHADFRGIGPRGERCGEFGWESSARLRNSRRENFVICSQVEFRGQALDLDLLKIKGVPTHCLSRAVLTPSVRSSSLLKLPKTRSGQPETGLATQKRRSGCQATKLRKFHSQARMALT